MSQTERYDAYQRPRQGWERDSYDSDDRWDGRRRDHWERGRDNRGGYRDDGESGRAGGGRGAGRERGRDDWRDDDGFGRGGGGWETGRDGGVYAEPTTRLATGARPARGQRAPRGGSPARFGAHDARFGVGIVAGCAALGALGTVFVGGAPGALLGVLVVLGTVVACLAVRPRASYVIIPVPALAYLVAALFAGVVDDHIGGASKTMYALGAVQWIAKGFFPMLIATLCAIALAGTRWLMAARRGW